MTEPYFGCLVRLEDLKRLEHEVLGSYCLYVYIDSRGRGRSSRHRAYHSILSAPDDGETFERNYA